MNIKQYIQNKKDIQVSIINFLDDGNDCDYKQLMKLLNDLNIEKNRNELKSILQLINAIIANHHRSSDFFNRIEKILSNYISCIKNNFSNSETFELFRSNQRILLYLFQNNLISTDDLIKLPDKFLCYFYPEIKSKIDKKKAEKIFKLGSDFLKNFNLEEFNAKRQIGENDLYVCKLIREDSIEEFIEYVNKTNLPLNGEIKNSIFETNTFLLDYYSRYFWVEKTPTIIEYAFFFGAVQIVKYLQTNNVKLTYELWPFAIHSNNAELIQILEENNLIPPESYFITRSNAYIPQQGGSYMPNGEFEEMEEVENMPKTVWDHNTFKSSLVDSITCHHIEIYNYIKSRTPEMKPDNDYVNDYYRSEFHSDSRNDVTFAAFKNFNYSCFPDEINDKMLFYYACKYDYVSIVEKFLNDKKIDVNMIVIFKKKFVFLIQFFLSKSFIQFDCSIF